MASPRLLFAGDEGERTTHHASPVHERAWVGGVVRGLAVRADKGARVVGAHHVVQPEAHRRLAAQGDPKKKVAMISHSYTVDCA